MLNKEQSVEMCDATGAESSTGDRYKIKTKRCRYLYIITPTPLLYTGYPLADYTVVPEQIRNKECGQDTYNNLCAYYEYFKFLGYIFLYCSPE